MRSVRFAVLAVPAVLAACGDGPSGVSSLIPTGKPAITGLVLARDTRQPGRPSARVVQPPGGTADSADVYFDGPTDRAPVVVYRRSSGQRADVAAITVGTRISVWTEYPITLARVAGIGASVVVIEP